MGVLLLGVKRKRSLIACSVLVPPVGPASRLRRNVLAEGGAAAAKARAGEERARRARIVSNIQRRKK